MCACFPRSLSRSSSKPTSPASRGMQSDNFQYSESTFSSMHYSSGHDGGNGRDKGFNPQELRFSHEIRDRLSRTYRELKPTIVNNSDFSFVNMSFLQRKQHAGSAPAHMVRRVSSMSLPSQDGVEVYPPQPTGTSGANGALLATYSVSRRVLEDAIMAEADKDKHAPDDLQSEETRLRQRLHRLRLDMLVVQGDGNCQFRAISFGLYGTQDRHTEVRAYAIAYMKRNTHLFAAYLGEEYREYLVSMAQSGTWGDELTLRAICEQYQLVINVIASTQSNWHLKYIPSKGPTSREVFITYISPIHYNAIRRRPGLAPLRASFRIAPPQSQVAAAYKRATSTANYIDSSSVV